MPKPKPQSAKKSGFRVGPRTAKNVYSGHQDKIKATLIHKAKVKKSYYKDLAEEGYGTGTNGGELGVRKGKKAPKPILGEQRRGPQAEGEEDEEADEEADDASNDIEMDEDDDSDDSDDEKDSRKSKGKGKATSSARSQPPPRNTNNNQIPLATKPIQSFQPTKKPRLTSPEIAAIREKKVAERKEWGQRGARGQPKLGGRVEMLLNRIKKSMA